MSGPYTLDDPAAATVSGIRLERDEQGVMLRFSDDPLDFVWQSDAQARDLVEKLNAALEAKP